MKTKNVLSSISSYLVIIIIIYIIVNLIHLAWKFAEPEGFWGFMHFVGVFTTMIIVILVFLTVLVVMFTGIQTLFSDFPKNVNLVNILKPLGIALFIPLIMVINVLMGSGISMYINKALADKYSYIEKSEELIEEEKYSQALQIAEKGYNRYGEFSEPSKFLFLSWIFYKSKYGAKSLLTKQYAVTINYAFCLHQKKDDLALSEKLYNDALHLSDSPILKTDSTYKIFPCLSLAELHLDKGDNFIAENYFNQLLHYTNGVSKDDISFVCSSQEIFASYFNQIGDFEKARGLRESNVTLWEKSDKSKKGFLYLSWLLSAITSEIITGNFDKAEEYLLKAKPLAESREEQNVYPVFLLAKGVYCNYVSIHGNGNKKLIDKGWFAKVKSFFDQEQSDSIKFKTEAESCFLSLLEIEKEKNGNRTLRYAQGLHRLAGFYVEHGDITQAIGYLTEAVDICKAYQSTNVHMYNTVLSAYTICEFWLMGYESVKTNIVDLENYHFEKLTANYSFLTERERETYKNIVDIGISPINSIYVSANSPEAIERLYNNIIATKEIALYANENVRANLNKIDSTLRNEYYSIIKQRDSIESVKTQVSIGNTQAANTLLLREKQVQASIKRFTEFTQFDPREIKWNNVHDALGENQAAIEFIHVRTNKVERYYALLITKKKPEPELIPLFEESSMVSLLNQPGNSEERVNNIYEKLKDSLFNLIWKPIEAKLTGVAKVYISVSGILHSISLPALLIDKNIDLILLGSTRQIAIQDDDIKYSSAVLIGDVNYAKSPTKNNVRSNYYRLPYTAQEIKVIDSIISADKMPIKITCFTKDAATEQGFRMLEKVSPNLVHIATHGYYYQGNYSKDDNLIMNAGYGAQQAPMLRSGLVLAGPGNNIKLNLDNDGFVSAQEISRMNLPSVDLAVLSACETGLGVTIGSEGVFGLQRAFKQAGVKSLIMSLWKVPDQQTALLMKYFYGNYLAKGMSKSIALKEAQKMISKDEKYKSPFYWGGFILLEK